MDREEFFTIDVDKLRKDMRKECLGAYFGGGFGGALMELSEIERLSDEKLVEVAQRQGINLDKYHL